MCIHFNSTADKLHIIVSMREVPSLSLSVRSENLFKNENTCNVVLLYLTGVRALEFLDLSFLRLESELTAR